jgi:hypothetical protein
VHIIKTGRESTYVSHETNGKHLSVENATCVNHYVCNNIGSNGINASYFQSQVWGENNMNMGLSCLRKKHDRSFGTTKQYFLASKHAYLP